MSFNVDWLNMVQEFPPGLYPDYYGGLVVSVQGSSSLALKSVVDDGGCLDEQWTLSDVDEVDYKCSKFALHQGSFETNLLIRMQGGRLEVRGNPSSFGRLDNVFGVDLDRAVEIYNTALRKLGLPEFAEGYTEKIWLQNEQKFVENYTGARITRIDYCQNLSVGMGNVAKYHQWLARQKIYRSSPTDQDLVKVQQWDYSTVYLSTSKYWMNVKVYDKGRSIEEVLIPQYRKKLKAAQRQGLIGPQDVEMLFAEAENYMGALACWCAEVGMSRLEYSLKSRWFAQSDGLGHWKPVETERQLIEFVENEFLKIKDRAVVYQVDAMENLTNAELGLFHAWKAGESIKDSGRVSRRTFYRVRKNILEKTGYDIAARPVGVTQVETRPVYVQMKPLTVADAPAFYQRAA